MTKGIVFYTDNRLPEKMANYVYKNIESMELPIVSCSLKPIDLGRNIVLDLPRGKHTMFKQMLTALENHDTDIVFFCEHDNLYPKEHFDFTPPNKYQFFYNNNWWKIGSEGQCVSWEADQVSGLCCYRELALEWYRNMVETFDEETFGRKYEPDSGEGSGKWMSPIPYIDIRHKCNLTYNKWGLHHFRNKATAVNFQYSSIDKIPGWPDLKLEDIYG